MSTDTPTSHRPQSHPHTLVKHAVILGGSSGIGLALARHLVTNGWHVLVVGSNAEKLNLLTQQHPQLQCHQCDLSRPSEREVLLTQLQQQPIDLLVYAAGYYVNERKKPLHPQQRQQMLAINLHAFSHICAWASTHLAVKPPSNNSTQVHQHRQLLVIASAAGLLDYPNASTYAQCKRAMISICQAHRHALIDSHLQVICVAPGYINTAQLRQLNAGDASHKPFMLSEQQAIQHICHALQHNLGLYVFPRSMQITIKVLTLLPRPLLNATMKWQYRRQDNA